MDFRQTTQPSVRPNGTGTVQSNTNGKENRGGKRPFRETNKWFKILNLVILLGVAVLLAMLALAVARGGNDNESQYVMSSKYQAVFLNNGQVYFGNIDSLNSQYIRLSNIYYLTQNSGSASSSSTSNYSLVKLGCQQIHDPYDQMVINRSQVTFWENLQDNGKVVKSIKQFQQQNPNGPDCSQVSSQTQASSNTTQNTSSTGTGTNANTGTTTTGQ